MTGTERLLSQIKDQEDMALKQTVDYLISRKDMEKNYLKEEKNIEGMCKFIKEKAQKHSKNGWNYITNEVVFAWAIMYFSLPDKLLGINTTPKKSKASSPTPSQKENSKNNVIAFPKEKEKQSEEKTTQLSLFGGV